MAKLEPDFVFAGPPVVNILSGNIDAVTVDPAANPTNVLDRTLANGINVTWELTGMFADDYLPDSFQLVAYLNSQAPGGTDYQFPAIPVPFLGSTGTASGTAATNNYKLTFNPPIAPAVSISIPANSVIAGPYRITVVLTHTPAVANPRVAGFIEVGMVQFF